MLCDFFQNFLDFISRKTTGDGVLTNADKLLTNADQSTARAASCAFIFTRAHFLRCKNSNWGDFKVEGL